MKIVNLLGGLGNQMFEYAMYLALKEAHPKEIIKVCTRSFNGYGLHNGLELQRIFGVELPEASLWALTRLAYPFFNYKTYQVMFHWLPQRRTMTKGTTYIEFNGNDLSRNDSVFYDGYWQNEKWFMGIRQKVLEAFRFPTIKDERNIELASLLADSNAVSCHVRRGDYLLDERYLVCTSKYYTDAISLMNIKVNPDLYIVFSDDIDWCKQNLPTVIGNRKVVYVDWNKKESSYRDMQLMSLCRHSIIANSSFSWWGAWLGQYEDKVVIAPSKWVREPIINNPICDNWIKIEV